LSRGKRGQGSGHIGHLRNRWAFVGVEIGLNNIAWQTWRTNAAKANRLTFNRALNEAATHRLRKDRNLTCAGVLDIALSGNRVRFHHHAFDAKVGGVIGHVRVHGLRHANRTALHQRNTGGCGRELCNSHFERHNTEP
jgi:hypothetical protein